MESLSQQKKYDYIIVGQGLAGTLLAHFLLVENKKILVVDQALPGATSTIAAGIVNPVTGRRIAKSWRFEALYDFAKKTYRDLEDLLGIRLWTDRNIVRALHNTFEENEWDRRGAYPEYEAFFEEKAELGNFEGKIKPAHAWGELRHCAQVSLPDLVKNYREKLIESGNFLEEVFEYQFIDFQQDGVVYKNFKAEKIIFCEGARATENPFFSYLPFVPTKGELLLVKIPGANFEKILKHHLFLVPLPGTYIDNISTTENEKAADIYWAGSTSRFEFDDPFPSEDHKSELLEKLENTLNFPFEILAHQAGIRPTVSDVRPFLGLHPEHGQLAIFNGLGTKGSSLGPFFAHQMAHFLLHKSHLDDEVNIRRFSKRGR